MTLTLFHARMSCSNGILFLLNDVGAAFETVMIDIASGGQHQAEYLAPNPKGKVPALGIGEGRVLTEFSAIAHWIAETHPKAGLRPQSAADRAKVQAVTDFVIGSAHMRGHTFVRMPQKFTSDPALQANLVQYGRTEVDKALGYLSDRLGAQDFVVEDFSVADAALFYFLLWMEPAGLDVPDNLVRYLARLKHRPG